MSPAAGTRDLVLVADVHIGHDDPRLASFCEFLRARAEDAAAVVLLGDVFSLWLGRRKFTEPHHAAVIDACRELRRRGVRVVFVEGNREFAARTFENDAFDVVSSSFTVESWGSRRWYLAHGDLLDPSDWSNRLFHRVARSRLVLGLFGLLPRRLALSLGARAERALRHRNLERKTSLPRERLEAYAAWLAARGHDGGVIGHIHVEMSLELPTERGPRQILILPDWRSAGRYLRIPADGPPRFEPATSRAAPAVTAVEDVGGRTRLCFEAPTNLAAGDALRIDCGHGPGGRRGRVLEADDDRGRRLLVELDDTGPPVQVGDRLGPET